MKQNIFRTLGVIVGALILLVGVGYLYFQKLTSAPSAVNPVLASAGPTVTLMDFAVPPTRDPPSLGWWEIGFLTKPKMQISFVDKANVKALRCETHGSGSIFGRHTDIDMGQFPNLSWSWLVEKPIVTALPEQDRSGDDHPARFLLHFRDVTQSERYFEIIWSNGAYKQGQWKVIGSFHHYVANGGDAKTGENTEQWFNETVNLLQLYRTATNRTDTPRLINISIFCDSDDTGAESIAYFGNVRLEK
jgi:hypothetical protein